MWRQGRRHRPEAGTATIVEVGVAGLGVVTGVLLLLVGWVGRKKGRRVEGGGRWRRRGVGSVSRARGQGRRQRLRVSCLLLLLLLLLIHYEVLRVDVVGEEAEAAAALLLRRKRRLRRGDVGLVEEVGRAGEGSTVERGEATNRRRRCSCCWC